MCACACVFTALDRLCCAHVSSQDVLASCFEVVSC